CLEGEFPGSAACAIAAAAISKNEQFGRVGITAATLAAPPLAKGFHREEWRVVGSAHDNHPAIGLKVVKAVRDSQPLGLGTEVVILNQDRLSAPYPTVVLELTNQFFLL